MISQPAKAPEKHQIIASALTKKEVGDPTVLPELLDQIDEFEIIMAEGAYDSQKVYAQVLQKQPETNIVIPPPKNAVKNASEHAMRNQHVDTINERGRMA